MTVETEGLILEQLRAIQGDVADIKARVARVESRLTAIDQTLGTALSEHEHERDTVQWFTRRVQHINGARH